MQKKLEERVDVALGVNEGAINGVEGRALVFAGMIGEETFVLHQLDKNGNNPRPLYFPAGPGEIIISIYEGRAPPHAPVQKYRVMSVTPAEIFLQRVQ